MFHTTCKSPAGNLILRSDGEQLTGLFVAAKYDSVWLAQSKEFDQAEPFATTRLQLTEYFDGRRTQFDLPLAMVGTDFQMTVWNELVKIPYAMTISYAELARRIEKPSAARAVGNANGRNPISIVIPCHRVIGADGSLTGYGGGLTAKQWLLHFEARRLAKIGCKSGAEAACLL
jgi:methylated-DNA-[protein]-cysteine S-methyltransferase